MTNMTISGLTASTQYQIKLFRPSAIDSSDADYLVATTSCVSDASGVLTVALVPTTGTLYYYAVFDSNTYTFSVPDSVNTLNITDNLTTPEKAVVKYASVTSVNQQTGAVVLTIADLTGEYVQTVNGKTGAATLGAADVGALPNTADVSALADTDIVSPANDQVLTYESGKWQNKPQVAPSSLLAYSPVPSSGEDYFQATFTTLGPTTKTPEDSSSRYMPVTFMSPASGKVKITVGFFLEFSSPNTGYWLTAALCSDTVGTIPTNLSTYPPVIPLVPNIGVNPSSIYRYHNLTFVLDTLTPNTNYTFYLGFCYQQTGSAQAATLTIMSNEISNYDTLGGPTFFLVEAL